MNYCLINKKSIIIVNYYYVNLMYFSTLVNYTPVTGFKGLVRYNRSSLKSCDYCGLRKPCCLGDNPNLPKFIPEKGLYHTWWFVCEALFGTFPKNDIKFGGQICRLLRRISSSDLTFIKGYSLHVQYKGCNFKINYLNPDGSFILLYLDMYYRRSSKGKKTLLDWLLVDTPISGVEYLFFKQHLLRLLTEEEFNKFASKLRKERVGDLFISILRTCLVKGRLPVRERTPSGGLEYSRIINCSECGSKRLSPGHCYKCLNSERD